MKLKMIPAAILASMAVAGAAQAQVTVYGLVDVSFGHTETGFPVAPALGTTSDLLNYSRNSTTKVGLKGSQDLGKGIKGNFNLEAGNIASAPAKTGAFFDRQAWVGMSGGFGEVRAGTQDSVAFSSLIGFDFNGASNTTYAGGLAGVPTLGQNVVGGKDLVTYFTPSFGGFKAQIGLMPKDNVTVANVLAGTADAQSKAGAALGLTYTAGPLAAALVFESATSDDATRLNSNNYTSIGASYDLGVVKLSGVYANGGTTAAGLSGRGMQVGIAAPVMGATIGVQYAKNTDTSNTGTEFFVNKEVLKNTTVYFDYGTAKPSVGNSTNAFSLGMIYVF